MKTGEGGVGRDTLRRAARAEGLEARRKEE